MITSIGIKNYRNLVDLQLKSIGRVNLITGKNNTGKSALLEAISIYATKSDLSWIASLLRDRGEYYRADNAVGITEANLKTFSSLFNKRKTSFYDIHNVIEIGKLEDTLFGYNISTEDKVKLRIVKYIEEVIREKDTNNDERIMARRRKIIEDENDEFNHSDIQIGLEIQSGEYYSVVPLDTDRASRPISYQARYTEKIQFIKTKSVESALNGRLWDNITLGAKEDYIVKALKLIEPDLERVTFINDITLPRQERIPVVKLKGDKNIVPLKSMGDGINRILTMILALVNADNGYLLIDEFENGLHYTVQEKLWEMIFILAYELNVQVFATTHSLDCIKSFEQIMNSKEEFNKSKLIRLDFKKGLIKQVEYNAEELKIATHHDIEPR